ncbi:hypothetical protein LPJ59_005094 [Coemansia sp. RSA 2399]|nr:hypothetical protein LPJ59_005094 [Coemansia sp. RSA 2399]KAJ1895669.1 hypothetical protein LPJ81_004910 [Coemansia sp. IMI 209127]
MDTNEDGRTDSKSFYMERTKHLTSMGARFKRWADEYQCAFICVNQVKDIIDPSKEDTHGPANLSRSTGHLRGNDGSGDSRQDTDMSLLDMDGEFTILTRTKKAPALGALWANIIDARIMMYQRRGLVSSDFRQLDSGQIQSETNDDQQHPPGHLLRTRRWIENDFSPWAPRAQCEVSLSGSGFQSIRATVEEGS